MTLANLAVGKEAKVVNVAGRTAVARRLMEMGVVPGVTIKVIKMAPFGDPIQIKVRGYSLAMRKSEAETIEVSE
jgi:ferrous iron transport protein A